MSASSKKKLRKEQVAAQAAEKQRIEKKEANKMKVVSTIFIAIMVIVLLIPMCYFGYRAYQKSVVALKLDNEKFSTVELSYYYMDYVNYQFSNNAWMLQIEGLDTSLPLNEQVRSDGTNWADYFVEESAKAARDEYAMRMAAKEAGFQLSEEDESSLQQQLAEAEFTATLSYGYPTFEEFLVANYGAGASEKSYENYLRNRMIAQAYYADCNENRYVYDDAMRREHEKDQYNNYSSFTYASYYMSYTNYLDVSVNEATDEQKDAARAALRADAESLLNYTTVEELDAAIAALPVNAENANAATTHNERVIYTDITGNLQEWLIAEDRKAGDMTILPNESTITDESGNETTSINGYTVVYYHQTYDNKTPLANVRHLLVSFEGGQTDTETNTTVYSDEEKAAAKTEAEAILNTWQTGDATEESFIALIKEKTDDTASAETGGLYEDITPERGVYVDAFTDWAVDESREVGDTGIIETEYGYHIMYYVGDSEITYRDYLIDNEMRTDAMEAWYKEVTEAVTYTIGNTKFLKKDLVSNSTEE